jgi:hypothetical protein
MQPERRTSDRAEIIGFIVLQFVALLVIVLFTLPISSHLHAQDLQTYYDYSLKLMQGQLPYHDFAFEYPPLALLPLTLPRIVALGQPLSYTSYVRLFSIQNVLLSTLAMFALVRIVSHWCPERDPVPALKVYTLLVVVSTPLLPWRYDLFPALLTSLALLAVLADRPTTAGLWLGLGIAAKLYPVVLLPVFGIYYLVSKKHHALLRLLLGSVGVTGAILLPFILLDLSELLSFLRFHQLRGLQIESVPAGAISLAHMLGLIKSSLVLNYNAWHITGPLAEAALKGQPFAFGLAFVVVFVSCWGRFRDEHARSGRITNGSLVAYVLAALLTFIVTNKVFSPQYIIWLLPLGPLLSLRQARTLLVICLTTIIIYPFAYQDLIAMRMMPVLLLNLRNILVVALLLWLFLEHLPTGVRATFAQRYK